MSRYVIANGHGLLHTDNEVTETVYVPRPGDPSRNDEAFVLRPVFDSTNVLRALKYDTVADAEAMLAYRPLVADGFDGCSVREVEFDRNPQAIR